MALNVAIRIRTFYSVFIRPSWSLKIPKNSKILILNQMSEGQQSVFRDLDTSNFYLDGTEINIYCLIKSVFTKSFWHDPIITYLKTYISCVEPLLVITFTDNFHPFYKLSSVIGSTKTMVIQNGMRGAFLDVFDVIEAHSDFRVDHMCVFGKDIGDLYARYIKCDVHVVGSTRNNFYPILTKKTNIDVLYLSQFIGKPHSSDVLGVIHGEVITFADYLKFDEQVLRLVRLWCKHKNKKITILPRGFEISQDEREYFASHLADSDWNFVIKKDERTTYQTIDSANIVVAVDSTLGYEALARGAKTALISCRTWNGHTNPFGWPSNIDKRGPFWADSLDPVQFDSIMNHLDSTDLFDWTQHIDPQQIIIFDEGNKHLVRHICNVVGIPGEIQTSSK
jgi:surface carbohydrate biosynthesis protein